MRLAGLLLLLAALQEDTAAQFYRFKVGTTWTLQGKLADVEAKLVITVTKEVDGKVYLDSKNYAGTDEKPKVENLVWYVQDGFWIWGDMTGGTLQPKFKPYKLGSKKGDVWAASDVLQATHMGTVEVTVPAGTFKDAVQIRMSPSDEKQAFSMYFAPGVGFVKTESGAGKVELVEFKEAK